jgi:hypothetical protein
MCIYGTTSATTLSTDSRADSQHSASQTRSGGNMRSLGNCSDVLGFTCISTPKLQTKSAHNLSYEYSHPSDTVVGPSPSLLYSALVPGTPGSRTPFHNLARMQPRGTARSLQGRVTCTTHKDSEEGCGLELLMEGLCDSASNIEVLQVRLVVYVRYVGTY